MSEFKIVIGDPKTGKSHQREIKDAEAEVFLGLKIKNNVRGDSFGLSGYEFEITGGSDKSGFPMRRDLDTTARKKILVVEGVGVKRKRKGQRQRKSVRGNTISSQISQINLKILKYGKEKLGEEKPAEGEAKKEAAPAEKERPKVEKPAEAPKKEVKVEPKKEEIKEEQALHKKPEDKKEESKILHKKEEPKEEAPKEEAK